MTVSRLEAEMGSAELTEWLAYYRVKNKHEQDARDRAEIEAGLARERTRKIGRR